MFLVIDNYDSFVHNLARYVSLTGHETQIFRNDALSVDEISSQKPEAIIISPGPCSPAEAGISTEIIEHFGNSVPILGVCLGHQCIAEAYGGLTIQADTPTHGKATEIHHNESDLFAGIPSPFKAGRYHSLVIDMHSAPALKVTARTEDNKIMAIAHETHPVYGVQFHPESILTEYGADIMQNFSRIVERWNTQNREAA